MIITDMKKVVNRNSIYYYYYLDEINSHKTILEWFDFLLKNNCALSSISIVIEQWDAYHDNTIKYESFDKFLSVFERYYTMDELEHITINGVWKGRKIWSHIDIIIKKRFFLEVDYSDTNDTFQFPLFKPTPVEVDTTE